MSTSVVMTLLLLLLSNATMAQTDFWVEDFTLPFGTKVDNGSTAWSTVAPVGCAVCPPDFEVDGNRFKVFAYGTEGVWTSQEIDISSQFNVGITIDANETGNLEAIGDYINFYYVLDGGPETPFGTNGLNTGDFNNIEASHMGLLGTTLQIVIRAQTDALNERIFFDNVTVSGTPSPLPFDKIELELESNDVDERMLKWDMNLSTKVLEIHVERSENGVNWESIHTIYGPFNGPFFEFVDTERYDATETYYRVRGLDQEGEEGFSNVVAAKLMSPERFQVYPNPTEGNVHYVLPSEGYTVSVISLDGTVVFQQEMNAALGTLSLEDVVPGVYIINAIGEGDSHSERIMVK
jgi:hypothetical protein